MHENDDREQVSPQLDDEAIRNLVARLSRPHASGGKVIERAAILAEGAISATVLTWITTHAGQAEEPAPAAAGRGLHAARRESAGGTSPRAPLRYVIPPGTL